VRERQGESQGKRERERERERERNKERQRKKEKGNVRDRQSNVLLLDCDGWHLRACVLPTARRHAGEKGCKRE